MTNLERIEEIKNAYGSYLNNNPEVEFLLKAFDAMTEIAIQTQWDRETEKVGAATKETAEYEINNKFESRMSSLPPKEKE